MVRSRRAMGALFVAAAIVLTPIVGRAATTHEGVASAGALVGYGFDYGTGVALGARAGYTFRTPVYVGGTAVYHLGSCQSVLPGGPCVTAGNIFYAGAEVGFDIRLERVTARPFLGLGDVVGLTSFREHAFGVWPGVALLASIDRFFVGFDLRVVIVGAPRPRDFHAGEEAFGSLTPSLTSAFALVATGGVTF